MFHDQIDLKPGADITSEDWVLAVIKTKEGDIQILTCPKCKDLNLEDIFNGYRKSILSGRNQRFH